MRMGGAPVTVTSCRSAWIVTASMSSSTMTRRSLSLAFCQIESNSKARLTEPMASDESHSALLM